MTILLTYTPSAPGASAAAAIAAAIAEARTLATDLVIINVQRDGALLDTVIASDEELAAIVERARAEGVSATIERPSNPDVVEAILDLVEKYAADRIVLGLRRRSAVGKLLLGSVAQRILLEAPCPILAVKPD